MVLSTVLSMKISQTGLLYRTCFACSNIVTPQHMMSSPTGQSTEYQLFPGNQVSMPFLGTNPVTVFALVKDRHFRHHTSSVPGSRKSIHSGCLSQKLFGYSSAFSRI